MIVSYEGDGEIVIMSAGDEELAVKDYFTEGGRDINRYDRKEGRILLVEASILARAFPA